MPHAIVPKSLQLQVSLLLSIAKRVSNDRDAGPLIAYLAKHNIILADDVETSVTVMDNYNIFLENAKTSQDFCEERNLLILPIINNMTGSIQFLKGFYQPNFKPLGDWGVTISTRGKITLPAGGIDWQTLILLIIKQNNSYELPNISPLTPYLVEQNIILADDASNIAQAIVKSTSMGKYKTISEEARQLANNDWAIPLAHIKLIVAFLMKLYKGNTKKLGYYGITVVKDPKVVKTRNMKILFGATKLNKRAEVGGTFINMGTKPLNIYKGKTATDIPIVLAPGEELIIPKGYSIFSVQNTSKTISGKLQVIPAKKAVKKG